MNEYKFNDISIGQKETFTKTITKEMEDKFREITGDVNPMHFDDAFANEISSGNYKTHVSFGMLTASLLSTLAGVYMPGKYSLIHSVDEIKFLKPVFAGTTLKVESEVVEKFENENGGGLIMLRVTTLTNNDEKVMKAKMKIIVLK